MAQVNSKLGLIVAGIKKITLKEVKGKADKMTTQEKINFSELIDNQNWKRAVIVFSQESFTQPFTEIERSYEIYNGQWGLDSSKMGRCIIDDCLDGKDNDVRLDAYDWKKEYCYIVE